MTKIQREIKYTMAVRMLRLKSAAARRLLKAARAQRMAEKRAAARLVEARLQPPPSDLIRAHHAEAFKAGTEAVVADEILCEYQRRLQVLLAKPVKELR